MVDLLERSLISKSPLTEVFLKNGESKPMDSSCHRSEAAKIESQNYKMKVKIITSKHKNMILYAEAEDDFIDFLFSFLTIPLGSIPKLLNDNSCMGCVDNLYQSVKNMNPSCYTKLCNLILNPRVAPQFGIKNQPLPILEHSPPKYWCRPGGVYMDNNILYITNVGVISKSPSLIQDPVAMKFYEPRCGDDGKKSEEAVGFVRRPTVFAVWDDLQMTPLTCTSPILFLKKLNIPLDDLEQHVVNIGEIEVTN